MVLFLLRKAFRHSPFLLMLVMLSGCSDAMTEEDLQRLGHDALEEYCIQEKVDASDFEKARIGEREGYDWVIEYHSLTVPKHVLILLIKNGEIVERHRLIE